MIDLVALMALLLIVGEERTLTLKARAVIYGREIFWN